MHVYHIILASSKANMPTRTRERALAILVCTAIACVLLNRDAVYIPESSLRPKETVYRNGECLIPNLTDFDQFYGYFDKPKAPCNHKEQVGGKRYREKYLDGDKWVCFDKGFKPDDCVVYSFGISNEWSFDDDMDLKRHCQVFAFDPTMEAVDHKRSQRISFYNLGLSNIKGYTKLRNKNCAMERYSGIVEKLGHRSTAIDYLKMDIEGSEIAVFKDILDNNLDLLDNIRQIGIEIHPLGAGEKVSSRAKGLWEIFHRLECLGWRLLQAEMNPVDYNHFSFRGHIRSTCYELVWIK